MSFPGDTIAKDFGYTLAYHEGNKQSATYMKDGIILTIWSKEGRLEARLEFMWKLLVIRTPNFALPNENWEIFESQITVAKDRLGVEE